MKKLAAVLAVVAVILAVVLGIQMGQKNKLQTELDAQKALVTQMEADKATLEESQTQVTDLSNEKTALTAELDVARKGMEDAQAQVTSLTEEKSTLAGELAVAQKNLEDVNAQVAALNEAKLALEGSQADAGKLQEEYAALLTQVETLNKASEDSAKVQADAVAKAEEEAKAKAALEADYEALKVKTQELETQLAEALKAAEAAAVATTEQVAVEPSPAAETTQEVAAVETPATEATQEVAAVETPTAETTQEVAAAETPAAEATEVAVAASEQPATTEPVAVAQEPVTITIFHTNDVHSRVEGNDTELIGHAKLATLVKEARDAGPVLLLDVGDGLHGMSFATTMQGESIVNLMNQLGYDAMEPGNHDFNYGYERLAELEKLMKFDVVNSNIKLEDGTNAFKPYVIKEVGGKRVALVGAANPQIKSAIHPNMIKGLVFDGVEAVEKAVADARAEGVDAVIVLAHWGADGAYDPNSAILAKIEGVDLVIDGHSHTSYENIEQVEGNALIVSAGEYLKTIGHVLMSFDAEGKVVIEVDPITFEETIDVQPDEEVLKFIEDTKGDIEKLTSEVVGSTKVKLEGDRENVRTKETNLGNLATDALRESTEADFALTNGGGIRTSVEVGDITKGNLIEVFPFGNSVVLIEVTGEKLLQAMEHGLRLFPEQNGGFPHISGGVLTFDASKEAGQRVVSLTIGGEEVDPQKTYKVATNDFMAAGGDDYAMFADCPVLLYGGTLDEALIQHIQEKGVIEQEVEGRIVNVQEAQENKAA